MDQKSRELRAPPPLPTQRKDWTRHLKALPVFNDSVERVHNDLCENEDYLKLLTAVHDITAVTGSLSFDNCRAAMMLKARATELEVHDVAEAKEKAIALSLNTVLRRYHQSRKERRNTVGGEIVTSDNHNDD